MLQIEHRYNRRPVDSSEYTFTYLFIFAFANFSNVKGPDHVHISSSCRFRLEIAHDAESRKFRALALGECPEHLNIEHVQCSFLFLPATRAMS